MSKCKGPCDKFVETDGEKSCTGVCEAGLTSIPFENWGVHETHCCKECGICKYGDDDNCPMVLGIGEQRFECEDCLDDVIFSRVITKEEIETLMVAVDGRRKNMKEEDIEKAKLMSNKFKKEDEQEG